MAYVENDGHPEVNIGGCGGALLKMAQRWHRGRSVHGQGRVVNCGHGEGQTIAASKASAANGSAAATRWHWPILASPCCRHKAFSFKGRLPCRGVWWVECSRSPWCAKVNSSKFCHCYCYCHCSPKFHPIWVNSKLCYGTRSICLILGKSIINMWNIEIIACFFSLSLFKSPLTFYFHYFFWANFYRQILL